MHNILGGCVGAMLGFIGGAFAGFVLGEHVVKPGLDGLVPKLAIASIAGVFFAALGFRAGKRAAGRQNPTDGSP